MESNTRAQSSNRGTVEISLSVEETNKLRKKLGLRPLRVSSSTDERPQRKDTEIEKQKQAHNEALRVKDRIEKARRKRIEKSILADRSISASALSGEVEDGNEDVSDDDPAVWVEKMRNRRGNPAPKKFEGTHVKKATERKSPDKTQYSEHDLRGLKVEHTEENFADNEQTILTLKDTDVLVDDDNESEKHEDVLQSIDVIQRNEKKRRRISGPSAAYDPTDSREFASAGLLNNEESDKAPESNGFQIGVNGVMSSDLKDASHSALGDSVGVASSKTSIAERLSISVALEGQRHFEQDYDHGEHVERAFARRKSKHGKSKKRKQRIETELRDALNNGSGSGAGVSGKLPPKPLSRVAAIRSKAMQKIEKEDHEVDEDTMDDPQTILHVSLQNARRKARSGDVDASVKRILKIIDQAEENTGEDGEDFDDTSANIIFNEIEQYVRNIPAVDDIPDDSSEEEQDVDVGQQAATRKESLVTHEQDSTSAIFKGNEEISNSSHWKVSESEVGSIDSRVSDMGVAAALSRFRAMGDLRNRREQKGRARDERIDWKALDGKVPVAPGQRSIKLTYTDESGHELTPKEAFRLMCHKFHGKGPSKNKRELRLRRQLQKIRLQQMANDDTPLGSSSALREETRRTGLAHVVLSGPSVAPVRSELERNSLAKVKKSSD